MAHLTGYLYHAGSAVLSDTDFLTFFQVKSVKEVRKASPSRWQILRFQSAIPLTKEDLVDRKAHYEYEVWVRASEHIVIMAHDLAIVEGFVRDHLLLAGRILKPTQVRVADLVSDLTRDPKGFALTYVSARVVAYGDALRTMMLWGEDLANAQLFREHANLFTGQQCGLRPITEDRESIRITAEGKASFYFEKWKIVEEILKYLNANKYMID